MTAGAASTNELLIAMGTTVFSTPRKFGNYPFGLVQKLVTRGCDSLLEGFWGLEEEFQAGNVAFLVNHLLFRPTDMYQGGDFDWRIADHDLAPENSSRINRTRGQYADSALAHILQPAGDRRRLGFAQS